MRRARPAANPSACWASRRATKGSARPSGHRGWALKPAAELEGIYIGHQSPVGDMPINPGVLGTQDVTLPMTVGVVVANAVSPSRRPIPARSFPISAWAWRACPSRGPIPLDSGQDASATAFALQFKAGLKGEVAKNLLLFAEYRHLTINPTQYTLGETLPPHLPTDSVTVSPGRQAYNLFVAGLQFRF